MASCFELALYSGVLECRKIQASSCVEEMGRVMLLEPFREWIGYCCFCVIQKTAEHGACHAAHGDAYKEVRVNCPRIYGHLNLMFCQSSYVEDRLMCALWSTIGRNT